MTACLVLALECLLALPAALLVIASFLLSPKRGRLAGLADELPERLGRVSAEARARLRGRAVWWLHAASAGEVAGLAPIVAALARRPEPPAVLLTTTTRSGREAARALPGVAWAQLAPLDAWPFVSRFLARTRPARLVVAETELWPSALILSARAGLSPALVNARLTPKSMARYQAAAALLAPALRSVTLVAAQTEEDAARFRALGVPAERVRVTGNSKYDAARSPSAGDDAVARIEALGWSAAPLFAAGSTHPIEEELVLSAFLAARKAVPALRLVLAPRHLERAADAADLLAHAGLRVARWSEAGAAGGPAPARTGGADVRSPSEAAEALLLDAMGVLPAFYPLARAAFVGGTMVPVGGHNLLEPALAGVPVLFGPHTGHIEDPARRLERGGGLRVRDAAELAARLTELARDEALSRKIGAQARATAEGLRGATERILALLDAPS